METERQAACFNVTVANDRKLDDFFIIVAGVLVVTDKRSRRPYPRNLTKEVASLKARFFARDQLPMEFNELSLKRVNQHLFQICLHKAEKGRKHFALLEGFLITNLAKYELPYSR